MTEPATSAHGAATGQGEVTLPAREPEGVAAALTGPGDAVVAASPGRETDVYVIGDVNPDILVIDADPVPEFGQVEKVFPIMSCLSYF